MSISKEKNTRLVGRAVIRISPMDQSEDVRAFLQGLVTQDMALVQSGSPQWSGLLTAQGKCLFDFFVWAHGEDILVDCEREQADALVKRLSLYRLRRKIKIAIDDSLTIHWSRHLSKGEVHAIIDSGPLWPPGPHPAPHNSPW